ncbi:glycosyl transferase family 1, partial [Phocaeicola vulgatus]
MKIVNICLAGSYNYGWGYQDNLISKYQHKNGNDVILIASRFTNDKNSEEYLEVPSEIKLDNGVKVIRLEHGLGKIGTKFLRHYKGLYKV